ncbi:hypothetical protein F5884DRAFT_790301 [Xylogone sp. PMI_703]|nr:hypothetical protein F5884DRAFT_790301 [Xylogone sp. PMI_703]
MNTGPPKGPPYPPTTAGLGGTPSLGLDVPVTAVFLALFIVGAIVNMAILQINRKRDHKFLFSGVMFGFCMARITTCVMRIVWANRLTNARIAIAAQIFVFAGVILIFIINLVFALRLLRALHPDIGWKRLISLICYAYIASIILVLAALITCTVQSFYTLSHNTRRIDHDVQLFGATYYAVTAFLPIPIVLISWATHHKSKADHFGSGSVHGKIVLLLFTSTILTLGAAFRAGTNFYPRPVNDPAWYHSKACFYIFNFTIEVIVVYSLIIWRFDKRFHIPDGANSPGDYRRGQMPLSNIPEILETEKL